MPPLTLGNRELYEPALENGRIDVVPEYAATLAEFLNTKANGANAEPVASSDATATAAALTALARTRGLKVLPPGKAVDQNAFAVSKDFADRHRLTTLSGLGAAKLKIKLAAGDECPDQFDLVLLADDKHLQNADNVLPVLNAQDAGDPGAVAALGRLTAVLTTADLIGLNKKVDAERRKPADVAADYVKSEKLQPN